MTPFPLVLPWGMAGRDDDLPFRIELWDDHDRHIEEVIALVSDYATAKSAFEARVIQKSR